MKALLILFVLFFAVIINARAQDTSFLAKKYPLTVVMKVKDVSLAVNLTTERQIALANLFQKEMAQIQAVMQNDTTGRLVRELKRNISAEFASILTPTELALYSKQRKGSDYATKPLANATNTNRPIKQN